MIDIIKQRQIISSYFNCIRFIQARTSKERATVESIRDFVKVSRTTADKIVNEGIKSEIRKSINKIMYG